MKRTKHIAFFQFKDTCTPEDIADVWRIREDLPKQIPDILEKPIPCASWNKTPVLLRTTPRQGTGAGTGKRQVKMTAERY